MVKLLIRFCLNVLILFLLGQFLEGFYLANIGAAVLASIVLTVLNWTVRPVLAFFAWPVTLLTLGLFSFVISAVTLLLAAFLMGDLFIISSFWVALLCAVILAIVQALVIRPLTKK
ncbi:phage holin family protein [Shouchella lonarensis]|uniref:Putative membrane protein n=1 Tax=Shouchella lonarensis TaxID=1464122 RepID=A0A1G6H268_9BACI|nr:phage holin family protein [Shouchella lonarensis]SDB88243.1 putative membrane protein [Shouchella lonarensis]